MARCILLDEIVIKMHRTRALTFHLPELVSITIRPAC